ncbi:MAG: carbohydrate kinase [Pseudomonadales bacterium]
MNKNPLIFGEVLFDIFPDGHQVLGGAPFNVAWNLQAFGQNPSLVSRIGNDEQGQMIRNSMIDWGMDTSQLQTDLALPTGKVEIQLQQGEPVYDIVSPCAYDAIRISPDESPNCRFLYHGSLALRDPASAISLQRIVEKRPECIFLDVNLRAPWWKKESVLSSIRQADWVKLNIDEFQLLCAVNEPDAHSLNSFISAFHLQGVILTRGAKGAEVLNHAGEHFKVKPNYTSDVADTVGAGDAFASVMIVGLMNSWPMQTTLERAQAFASGVVGLRGATVSDIDFYKNIMSRWDEEKNK